jgi:hypothetical protein
MNYTRTFPAVLLFLVFLSFSAHSQTIKVGAGSELRTNPPVSMLTKITYNLGLIHPDLRISGDFVFLPVLEGNVDLHYSFINEFGFNAYALGGANFAEKIGVGLGGGINIQVTEELDAFMETKYLIKHTPEATIKVGLLYYL